MIKKVKNIVSWTCINDLNAEEILGKGNKLYINGKDAIIRLIAG